AQRGRRLLVGRLEAAAPRWGGLWLLPTVEQGPQEVPAHAARRALTEAAGLHITDATPLHCITHSITRYRVTLTLCASRGVRGVARARGAYAELRWVEHAALAELAMPAPQRKLANWL